MKFKDKEYAVGVAYDWINERGYQVPAREIAVWSHELAVHDWVLVTGDWHGQWEEVECIPFVPMSCVEPWTAFPLDDNMVSIIHYNYRDQEEGETTGLDLDMLSVDREYCEEYSDE
jgi:hypothetical protein